ncbi:hypothetical protein BT67DRAFT_365288, partial [Trichocladium antarcticum]
GPQGMAIDPLWRLARLQPQLRIDPDYVGWLRKCIGVFVVAAAAAAGGGGWLTLRSTDIIIAARKQVLPEVFATAQTSLRNWTARIARDPCKNALCRTNRIAALKAFLRQSGLFPRTTTLAKSLHEIITALHYITATDGKLLAAA